MSKDVKRKCPSCGEIKNYRADQKTCGCSGSNPSLNTAGLLSSAKKFLLGKPKSVTDLANKLDVAPKQAIEIIKLLEEKGFNAKLSEKTETAVIDNAIPSGGKLVVDSGDFFNGKWYTFGAIGDTHLYSKYARMDVLDCLYDIFLKEGIKTVFHTGNAIEGECRFNKFDLVGPAGMGPQVDYFAEHYPQRKGITTRFITGDDHEGWFINREGVNIGQSMENAARDAGRKDLQWLGHIEADVTFRQPKGSAHMKVMHPGGGSAYAISYTEQKIIESFQGGEKPHILLLGHYHKMNQGYAREVHTVQTGCTQDQTPFLRKLKIQVHVGGTIIRFHQAKTGEINRFLVEWIPYYDRGFYEKNDKYRRW